MIKRGKKFFRLLAEILEYPTDRIVEQIDDTMNVLAFMNLEAKLHLAKFRQFCLDNQLSRLEQIHIRTFDRNPACCPYVGYHLFDAERSRSLFIAKLKEHYSAHLAARKQLPDHLCMMLRSLVVQESVEEARDLIVYCLIPAVRKMIALLKDTDNPYRDVLQAVLLTLETEDRNPWGVRADQYGEYEFAGPSEKKRYG